MSNKIALKTWDSWNPRQQTYRMSKGQYNSKHFWCNDVGRKKVVVQCGDLDEGILFEIVNDVKPYAETKKQDDGTEIKVVPEKEHKENQVMMACPDDHPCTPQFTQWDSEGLAMCQENHWWGEEDDPPVVLKKSYTGCWRSMPKKDKAEEHQPLFKAKLKLVGADATQIILLDEDGTDEDGNMMYAQRDEPGTREDLVAGAMCLPMVRVPKVYSTESKWGFTKELHEIYVIVPKATGPSTMVSKRVRKAASKTEDKTGKDDDNTVGDKTENSKPESGTGDSPPASPKRRLTSQVETVPAEVETVPAEVETGSDAGSTAGDDTGSTAGSDTGSGAATPEPAAAELPAAEPTPASGRRRNRLQRSFAEK